LRGRHCGLFDSPSCWYTWGCEKSFAKIIWKKTTIIGVKIASQIAAAPPYIIFIAMNMIGSLSAVFQDNQIYASHTPYCSYTSDELSNFNVAYQCKVHGDANPNNLERGDHLGAHNVLGISTIPVFTSPDTYLNLTEAVKAASTFDDPTTTNTSAYLMYDDYIRIFAQHKSLDALKDYVTTIVIVLFEAQIFSRVICSSFDDVLTFNVTKLEAFIVLNTSFLVILTMYMSSLDGKSLESQLLPILLLILLLV